MQSVDVTLGNGLAISPHLGSGIYMIIMKYICMYYTAGSEVQRALVKR